MLDEQDRMHDGTMYDVELNLDTATFLNIMISLIPVDEQVASGDVLWLLEISRPSDGLETSMKFM